MIQARTYRSAAQEVRLASVSTFQARHDPFVGGKSDGDCASVIPKDAGMLLDNPGN